MGEPFGENRLGLARECLDRAIELAREPTRGILAARLDERAELLRRFVGIARRCALHRSGDLLDLPALDVLEPGADALRGFDLFALDPFHQLLLAAAHAFLELAQCAAAFGRLALDLC